MMTNEELKKLTEEWLAAGNKPTKGKTYKLSSEARKLIGTYYTANSPSFSKWHQGKAMTLRNAGYTNARV